MKRDDSLSDSMSPFTSLFRILFVSMAVTAHPEHVRQLNGGLDELSQLYSNVDGVNWNLNNNWMIGNPCPSGDWYGVSCIQNDVAELNLFDNDLDGTLPSELGTLSRLSLLNLASNSLRGQVPSQFGSFTMLSAFQVFDNSLSGPLPSELGRLTLVVYNMSIGANQFSGTLPSEIGLLTRLSGSISLHHNNFTGWLPSELGLLDRLSSDFDMSANSFSGFIPSQIGSLNSLERKFDISSNGFCGQVPSEVSVLSSQVAVFDVLGGSSWVGVSCCVVEGIVCTPSPTSSPPTLLPTSSPLPSMLPTSEPTRPPTPSPSIPTILPTPVPTRVPTPPPTRRPSIQPTPHPTAVPTATPTRVPTFAPTLQPFPLPTTPMPVPQPTAWIEAESNLIGIMVGCVGFGAVVAFIIFKLWKRRQEHKYFSQQIEMRPTAVTTSMMYTGKFKPASGAIAPNDDLTAGSTQSPRPSLPVIDNQQEYDEAMHLWGELQAHGLVQFFNVLWSLGVREVYQLQHVIKTDFDEANMTITLAQLKALQRMGKKAKK